MSDYDSKSRGPRGRRSMPLSELDPALTEVSRELIGSAIEVHMELGPGYSRDVYMNAVCSALDAKGISHRKDVPFDVSYKDTVVGRAVADLFVGERFLVKLMARPGEVGSAERVELRAQLRAADLELGLIVNFAERRLKDGLVRVLNPDKLNMERDHDHDDDGDEHD